MKGFKWFCAGTEKIMRWIVGYMMLIMTVLAFTGVLTRYVFVISIPWIEEATRYFMVWMTFLVCALAVGDGSHTSVDILPSILNKRLKRFNFNLILDVLIMIGMGIFFYYNLLMIQSSMTTGNTTPVLKIPMWMMYCSTLVCSVFSVLYCIRNIIVHVEKFKGQPVSQAEGKEAEI